jgi:hypothetical protein
LLLALAAMAALAELPELVAASLPSVSILPQTAAVQALQRQVKVEPAAAGLPVVAEEPQALLEELLERGD